MDPYFNRTPRGLRINSQFGYHARQQSNSVPSLFQQNLSRPANFRMNQGQQWRMHQPHWNNNSHNNNWNPRFGGYSNTHPEITRCGQGYAGDHNNMYPGLHRHRSNVQGHNNYNYTGGNTNSNNNNMRAINQQHTFASTSNRFNKPYTKSPGKDGQFRPRGNVSRMPSHGKSGRGSYNNQNVFTDGQFAGATKMGGGLVTINAGQCNKDQTKTTKQTTSPDKDICHNKSRTVKTQLTAPSDNDKNLDTDDNHLATLTETLCLKTDEATDGLQTMEDGNSNKSVASKLENKHSKSDISDVGAGHDAGQRNLGNDDKLTTTDSKQTINTHTVTQPKDGCASPGFKVSLSDLELLKKHDIHTTCKVDLGRQCSEMDVETNTGAQTTPPSTTLDSEPSTSERKHSPGSPVSFLTYDDTGIESLDEDDDSDSDDELLTPAAAYLQSIKDIINRPAPRTPTKPLDGTPNSSQNLASDCDSPDVIPQHRRGKMTLDGLFLEHEENADNVRELNEINKELQQGIKQGGFIEILNKEEDIIPEDSFNDEQRQMLQHLEVHATSLQQDWPGVVTFTPDGYQCLFNKTVHPTHCEFVASIQGGRLEKHIESLTVDRYKMILTSQMLPQLFLRLSSHNQLFRWFFYIMSIHDDEDIQRGCHELLLEILHTQSIDGLPKWTPRLIDVLSILVNYGANLESLLPCGPTDVNIIRGKLFHQPSYNPPPNVQQAGHDNNQRQTGYPVHNLILVLKVLAQSLNGQCGRYSPNDTSLMFYALCKVILDPSMKSCVDSMGAIQNCLTMVIRQYTETDWQKERLRLCRMLPNLSNHHHDHSHVAHLLPNGERGLFVQQRYSYLVTSKILTGKMEISDNELENFEIVYLERFIDHIRELLENNPYTLSSIIKLIDLGVGLSYTLNAQQRDQLKSLNEKISRVRVKACLGMLDRSRVKNMIVMVTSRWALELQTERKKQKQIFEYASSPVKMHIETLKQVQSSDDEEEDDLDTDEVPQKIRKLSHDDDTELKSQNNEEVPQKIRKLSNEADSEIESQNSDNISLDKIQKSSNDMDVEYKSENRELNSVKYVSDETVNMGDAGR